MPYHNNRWLAEPIGEAGSCFWGAKLEFYIPMTIKLNQKTARLVVFYTKKNETIKYFIVPFLIVEGMHPMNINWAFNFYLCLIKNGKGTKSLSGWVDLCFIVAAINLSDNNYTIVELLWKKERNATVVQWSLRLY
nr:hypothetical protein [Providencia rettgeri]